MNKNTESQTIEISKIVDWQIPEVPDIIRKQVSDMVKRSYSDVSQTEVDDFIYYCACVGLNPLLRDVYPVPFKDQNGRQKLQYITSIDYLRKRAHRTGEFTGCDTIPIYKNNELIGAQCTVTRDGKPFTARVKFSEYSTGKNLWIYKPETMICKVAEAHALRLAFPEETSRLYTEEEFGNIMSRKTKFIPNISNNPNISNIQETKQIENNTDQKNKLNILYTSIMEIAEKLGKSKSDVDDEFSSHFAVVRDYKNKNDFDRAEKVLINIKSEIEKQLNSKGVE